MTLGLFLALAAQTSTVAAPAKPPVDPAAEKPVCRRIVETGSFVKAKKVCMTRDEWAHQRDESRNLAQRTVSDGSGRAGGN